MKLTPCATSKETAREPCGQPVRGSLLGERCGEMVAHACDECGVRVCWLHTKAFEGAELCPACADARRATLDTLSRPYRSGADREAVALKALQAKLARLSVRPRGEQGWRRVRSLLRRFWWRLWSGCR
jgi:hypothetical protein